MSRWVGSVARAVGAAGVLLAVLTRTLAACPSCKEALSASDRWAMGFNASILFMMAMPFAVVAVVAAAIYRARRRRDVDSGAPTAPGP